MLEFAHTHIAHTRTRNKINQIVQLCLLTWYFNWNSKPTQKWENKQSKQKKKMKQTNWHKLAQNGSNCSENETKQNA